LNKETSFPIDCSFSPATLRDGSQNPSAVLFYLLHKIWKGASPLVRTLISVDEFRSSLEQPIAVQNFEKCLDRRPQKEYGPAARDPGDDCFARHAIEQQWIETNEIATATVQKYEDRFDRARLLKIVFHRAHQHMRTPHHRGGFHGVPPVLD
jgi:hypothetical protein